MKKLIILLTAMVLTSCTQEDSTMCECKEVMEISVDSNPGWQSSGQEFPTEYGCDSDGYTYGIEGYYSHATGQYVSRRRRVVCK
jgi:hypothetical protein